MNKYYYYFCQKQNSFLDTRFFGLTCSRSPIHRDCELLACVPIFIFSPRRAVFIQFGSTVSTTCCLPPGDLCNHIAIESGDVDVEDVALVKNKV